MDGKDSFIRDQWMFFIRLSSSFRFVYWVVHCRSRDIILAIVGVLDSSQPFRISFLHVASLLHSLLRSRFLQILRGRDEGTVAEVIDLLGFLSRNVLKRSWFEFRKCAGSMEPCACQNGHEASSSPRMGARAGSRSLEESLECPVCWESFNDRENTPYVLWCGHSLCKNCVLNLEWATVKLSGLPLHFPLFISCPWCQFLTFRFKWRGQLRYPCKNFFLLWIVESLQGELGRPLLGSEDTSGSPSLGLLALIFSRTRRSSLGVEQRQSGSVVRGSSGLPDNSTWSLIRWRRSGSRVVASFLQFTARIPLVLLFLFIVVYVLPISTLVLALYCLITVLFAVPSFLVVYFSYPSLDWLVRAIAS